MGYKMFITLRANPYPPSHLTGFSHYQLTPLSCTAPYNPQLCIGTLKFSLEILNIKSWLKVISLQQYHI